MKKVNLKVDGLMLSAFVLREVSEDKVIVLCQDRIIKVRYYQRASVSGFYDVVVPIEGNILVLDLTTIY